MSALAILVVWIGQQLASNVESEFWGRAKTIVLGDSQAKPIAVALDRSITAAVDAVANADSKDVLHQAVLNAFAQYRFDALAQYRYAANHPITGTALADLRYSIDCTLRQSGLNSPVPNESMTQLQYLAPGISIDRLVSCVTQSFVINIKKMATTPGSPLHNLSDQLNADEIRESIQQLSDETRSAVDKVAILLESNRYLLSGASRDDRDQDQIRDQVVSMYKTLKVIHADYLSAFADAEKALRAGIGSADLIHFLETRRAVLAAERIEETAHAEILSSEAGARTNGFSAFAEAVSEYFKASNGPTRITYFTSLLIYVRDKLQLAEGKQTTGAVRIDDYFFTTADHGQTLINALGGARMDIQRRFEEVARVFAALEFEGLLTRSEGTGPSPDNDADSS